MPACESRHSQAVRATIASLEGEGTVWHRHHTEAEPLSTASLIAAGDKLELRRGSIAAISLVPGIFLQIGDQTVLSIEQLAIRKDGDAMEDAVKARSATIRLERGRIRVLMPKAARHRCEVRIQTNSGVLAATRNSLFSIVVTEQITRIVCVNGNVDWNNAVSGERTTIAPGFYLDAGSQERGTAVRAELDEAAEREVEAIYDAAGSLEKIAAEMRAAPIRWH